MYKDFFHDKPAEGKCVLLLSDRFRQNCTNIRPNDEHGEQGFEKGETARS